MSSKFYFLSFILVVSFAIFTSTPALAISDVETRTIYRDILDRDPSLEELKSAKPLKGVGDLRNNLNDKVEREKVLKEVYQKALNREPRKDEIETLKKFRAPVAKVKDQLFSSQERKNAIADTYRNLLGRDPSQSDADFFIRTRADVSKIQSTVLGSSERQQLVDSFVKKNESQEGAAAIDPTSVGGLKIKELIDRFGSPRELDKKSSLIKDLAQTADKERGFVEDKPPVSEPQKPLIAPDMSGGVIPCQIEGGEGRPKIGLCRFEFVPRTHFGALESTLGEGVNSLDTEMVPKILVIHIKEMTGATQIKGEITGLTPEKSKELLPLPVDEKLSAIDEKLRGQLQEIRAKKEALFQERRSMELRRKGLETQLSELRTRLLALRGSSEKTAELLTVESEFKKLEGLLSQAQDQEQALIIKEKAAGDAEKKLLATGPR